MSILGFPFASRAGIAPLPPDLAFLLRHGTDPAVLARAADRARAWGTDGAGALLATGAMTEDVYYRALAAELGTPFLADPIPLGAGARYPDSLVAGLAPLEPGAPAAFVLAPRGGGIAELLRGRSPTDRMPALTTPGALRLAIFAANPKGIAAHAADALQVHRPDWALKARPMGPSLAIAGLVVGVVALAMIELSPALVLGVWTLAQLLLLAMVTLRVAAVSIAEDDARVPEPLADADLPVYTVFVALHREAKVVPRLAAALSALDYPAAKLDVKFLIEAHDTETAAALKAATLPPGAEIVVVPPGLPRTKPRALNAALPLARGSCLVVYDAEDVPDPGQLRAAAALFARSDPKTACLQGRLVMDNERDGLLQTCFALEYAALFDVLIPALAAWNVPIPLGGTSTHFRTHILRAVHGWDAWNVTEDADLGLRLARAGYRVGDLPSSTYEEAPVTLGAWLPQRARWMKGFIQTSFTHGRDPGRTLRDLGPLGSLAALALVPGTVACALVYPFFMGHAVYRFLFAGVEPRDGFWVNLPTGTALTVFLSGFLAMLLPAALGCVRRGWGDLLRYVPLMPAYFLLVSAGAWLGLVELIFAPDRWNKTEHGLARSSRSGALNRAG
ncbi:glycosyltransferase family 2 protein [Methylobacterium gossipiicola]|uniref:Glycosyltransferase, catalytic subunit of cellulose synthase and poly-beta-1,6-N-acetylglucosamine synthase n=1 Tax=Methylobacterium gossipiicola TaxID=582675 RepID=A0A1I2X5H5_9HYPH|nr:glycosyltransferase family 2 protein [Methylobacterium gossipiicola]SFH07191.1 Glycosyltransferase, catalytic subunit of cellulose synthase and poly-beta-1,6-N-acetylglucosamine synthase [Methylobacterium gossipiicola]